MDENHKNHRIRFDNHANHGNLKIQGDNYENHENHRMPQENNENHQNINIPSENHETHENLRIPHRIIKSFFLKFYARITKIIEILTVNARSTKIIKKNRIPCENNENQ